MNKPQRLYKYQPISIHSLANLKNNCIWFSSVNVFNDPFEMRLKFDENSFDINEYKQLCEKSGKIINVSDRNIPKILLDFKETTMRLAKSTSENQGVACFSEVNDDILMWSHYADKHKGFCLEFDTKFTPFDKIRQVTYSDDYPMLPLAVDKVGKSFLQGIATKSKHWSYEKEWRLIHQEKNTQYIYENKCLTGVYFGALMDHVYKEIICLILMGQNREVKFYEGLLDDASYQVKFRNVQYTPYIERKNK